MRANQLIAVMLLAGAAGSAWSQQGATGLAASLPLMVAQGPGGTSYSVPVQTLLFFTALSFLPALLLLMTGFTRIVIVLSLMRQALGTQAAPPNQVILGKRHIQHDRRRGAGRDRVSQLRTDAASKQYFARHANRDGALQTR